MTSEQLADLQVLRDARDFLDLHADALEAINNTPARASLDVMIQAVDLHHAGQIKATHDAEGLTAVKRALHARLRNEIGRILDIVHARADKMPLLVTRKKPSPRASDRTLIADGGAVVKSLESYRAELAHEGAGEHVVENLAALVQEFERACAARSLSWGLRTKATSGIRSGLQQGFLEVKVLRSLFNDESADHRRLLAGWARLTRHAERIAPPAERRRLKAGAQSRQPALPPAPSDSGSDGALEPGTARPALPAPEAESGVIGRVAKFFRTET